jgi:hypothetical protein
MIVAKWGPSRKDATFCTGRKPPYLICDSLRKLFREDQQGHETMRASPCSPTRIIGVNFSRVRIILWEMKIHFLWYARVAICSLIRS